MSSVRNIAAMPRRLNPPPLPDASARWALLLDVDGTLLDFADDPQAVQPEASLVQLLHALQRQLDGALALVSGRSIDELDRLFERPRWAAAGLHGLQLRHADGSFRRLTMRAGQQQHMREQVLALAARFEQVQWEDKGMAVALHYRCAPAVWPLLHEAAQKLVLQLPGYELQPGDHVLEFKPCGMDKGRAVRELLARAPFNGRLPVYLGDDLTDEHAFARVNRQHGLSIRVGSREPSLARFTLPDPAAAIAWLSAVRDALTPRCREP